MKAKYFLLNDDEFFNKVILAQTWRQALRQMRDIFRMQGRVRITKQDGNRRDYKLVGSDYRFTLTAID